MKVANQKPAGNQVKPINPSALKPYEEEIAQKKISLS